MAVFNQVREAGEPSSVAPGRSALSLPSTSPPLKKAVPPGRGGHAEQSMSTPLASLNTSRGALSAG